MFLFRHLFTSKSLFLAVTFFCSSMVFAQQSTVTTNGVDQQAIDAAISQANLLSRAFRDASKHVIPATVKVATVLEDEKMSYTRSPLFDFGGGSPRNEGLGTGIIIDPKGLVLTNNHVIKDAKKITILLSDGREYDVIDKKLDSASDLALLTIKPDDGPLPSVTFADSDSIDVGDWVLAVGNPFDLESTVSVGIISARWRTISGVTRGDFLQTDAAINPGNSGGPLINLRGEVVGINTAIVSQTGSNSGVGFAIASNTAHWVAQQLTEKGKVDRAYLGVQIEMVDAKIAASVGAKPKEGVFVNSANRNTPASEAGIKPKDIILEFDGRKINSPSELQSVVERSDINTQHEVSVFRDKKVVKLPIKVAVMPSTLVADRTGGNMLGGQASFYNDKVLGMTVLPLTPYNAERFGYQGLDGVLVLNVLPNSLAANAGIENQMLITKVDETPVTNVDEYSAARKKSSLEKGVKFSLETEKGPQEITIQQTKRPSGDSKKSDDSKKEPAKSEKQ